MTDDKWYASKLSKRGRVAHRPGHWRLGDKHSKCGHPIGRDVTADVKRGYLDICLACEPEVLKEKARLAKLTGSSAPFVCSGYVRSGKLENRNGTVSDFCRICEQPHGYHK